MSDRLDDRTRRVNRFIDDLRQRCPAHCWHIHYDSDLLSAFGQQAIEAHDPPFLRFAAAKISARNFEQHAVNAARAFLELAHRFDHKQAEANAWRDRYSQEQRVVGRQAARIQWLEGQFAHARDAIERMRAREGTA